ITSEFEKAGVSPDKIDTGAVIITGETAKKENAKRISDEVAGFAGDFVVATAGGKLESVIAGKGSGAYDFSEKHFCTIANIDIGGGTANIGIFKNGIAIDSCCINVGGRLLCLDGADERITSIARPMKAVIRDCNLNINVGETVTRKEIELISRRMGRVILECLGKNPFSDLAGKLLMTQALRLDYDIDQVMISGGVADHVYGGLEFSSLKEIAVYGDIGPMLGKVIADLFKACNITLIEPTETIRATVIGAGARTVDVSGSTILVDDAVLPFKNIPVAVINTTRLDEKSLANAVVQSIETFFEKETLDHIALGLGDMGYLNFEQIVILARGIVKGLESLTQKGLPVIIVLEQDLGKVLGQSIRSIKKDLDIICVDQLKVNEGDYIDMSTPSFPQRLINIPLGEVRK
ncbi:MAG: ethanolamine ammonia-lyase reactivating factor EutA, partial [Thermodesulfobacteriota bacterium]|nr:ethanolamine ammonia-lyase reactivating factor EutA [Thermodesulfobacteriota bacterium]